MSYIGSKPADAVLETDDITDGVITTSKLADNSVTTAKTSYQDAPFRNIIINGDMSIAQRGTSVSGITSGDSYRTVDRFTTWVNSIGTWTMSQDTDVPTGQGFTKSHKIECTTADASLAAGDGLILATRPEGQNLQYLKKGTANAESVTLSFWIKSNKTGTYICELRDQDNSRQISKSYTISASDTWEKKTITFAGDTTGAFDNDNGNSLDINWWLGAGSTYSSGTLSTTWTTLTNTDRAVGQVNLADSTSNYINITGVQLEAGTTASDFEFLPVDVNLQRCQRYYQKIQNIVNARLGAMGIVSGTSAYGSFPIGSTMRSTPTISDSGDLQINDDAVNSTITSYSVISLSGTIFAFAATASGGGLTQRTPGTLRFPSSTSYLEINAEL